MRPVEVVMADSSVSATNRAGDRPADQGAARQQAERRPVAAAAPVPTLRQRDEVHLSAPGRVALQLLRERVLARTRVELALGSVSTGRNFTVADHGSLASFIDQLLSQQNLLASARGAAWPPERIRLAVAEGMAQGAAETLEVLLDSSRHDGDSVQLVIEAMAEYGKKLGAEPG